MKKEINVLENQFTLIDGFLSKKASTNVYEVIDTNKIRAKSNITINIICIMRIYIY